MHPELFRIPLFGHSIPIYGYGLMLVLGFLGAVELAKFLARRSRLDPEIFINAAMIALLAGVVGARLSHVLENFGQYTDSRRTVGQNLWAAVNISSGGLTYYGGFLLAFPALLAYGRYKRVPLRLGMDIVAPCLMIGLGFGRIGCLLNGCCYGATSHVPWAITFPYHSIPYNDQFARGELTDVPPQLLLHFPSGTVAPLDPAEFDQINAIRAGALTDGPQRELERLIASGGRYAQADYAQALVDYAVQTPPADLSALASAQRSLPVHPAQPYSTFTAWLIAAFLVAYFTLPHTPGRVFALMMMVEGLSRYLLELLRVEPPVIGQMSLSMVLGLVLLVGGALLWWAFGIVARRFGDAPHHRVPTIAVPTASPT